MIFRVHHYSLGWLFLVNKVGYFCQESLKLIKKNSKVGHKLFHSSLFDLCWMMYQWIWELEMLNICSTVKITSIYTASQKKKSSSLHGTILNGFSKPEYTLKCYNIQESPFKTLRFFWHLLSLNWSIILIRIDFWRFSKI